ncbi:MAG: hypothetical protein IH851_11110 [Armatimonadetes bacterium]|nr:hypothetical protein [Armatimonadota bacterium]
MGQLRRRRRYILLAVLWTVAGGCVVAGGVLWAQMRVMESAMKETPPEGHVFSELIRAGNEATRVPLTVRLPPPNADVDLYYLSDAEVSQPIRIDGLDPRWVTIAEASVLFGRQDAQYSVNVTGYLSPPEGELRAAETGNRRYALRRIKPMSMLFWMEQRDWSDNLLDRPGPSESPLQPGWQMPEREDFVMMTVLPESDEDRSATWAAFNPVPAFQVHWYRDEGWHASAGFWKRGTEPAKPTIRLWGPWGVRDGPRPS